MKFKGFTGGLNTQEPAEDIADNELTELVNVCYDEGSLLRSRYGFTLVRSATSVTKIHPFYVNGTLHLIYTASGGLYDNGTLLDANFTGPFVAAEYAGMLYLCNGTYFKRYDGSTLYNVGMDAPDPPTVSASSQSEKVLDDFEDDPVEYTVAAAPFDGGGSGTVTRDTSTYFEGTASIKVVVPQATKVKITRTFSTAQDWSGFSGSDGTEDDYITFKVYVENPDNLRYFQVLVDVDDGTFNKNYFYSGKTVQGVRYETITKTKQLPAKSKGVGGYRWYTERIAVPYTELDTSEVVLPRLPGTWVTFKMPKGDFSREGTDTTKGWDTVKGLGFCVWANDDTGGDNLVLYIDDGKMRGAGSADGGFYGKFYFCACYYNQTRDEYYEVSTESDPVECDINGVTVSNIPATFPDAQATHYVVWARREDWANWFRVAKVAEGTTSVDTSYDTISIISNPEITEQAGIYPLPKVLPSGETKTRENSNNTPPPVPDFIVVHRGKMFYVVDNLIYHSKPGQPWAVPSDFYLEATSTSDPVQGLYSDGANLTVHSKSRDFNYINAGDYDAAGLYMGYLAEARRSAGCVSRYSIHSGLYASSFGICTFDGQDGISLSDKIKPTYRAISSKSSLHGVVYEDFYLLINPDGNSIVMQQVGDALRFFNWSFVSTARCCAVDPQSNTLYVGTDTGIYKYDRNTYKDSEGDFAFSVRTKLYEYAPEDKDLPLERATVRCNTGGNSLSYDIQIDGSSVGNSGTIQNTAKTEEELFLNMGTVGSFLQMVFSGTITEDNPIRIYQIEVS